MIEKSDVSLSSVIYHLSSIIFASYNLKFIIQNLK
jgi:hypothetical protein